MKIYYNNLRQIVIQNKYTTLYNLHSWAKFKKTLKGWCGSSNS